MVDEQADLARGYQDAKRAVGTHRRAQAQAEQARSAWLRKHRHLNPYGPDGAVLHPELAVLEAAVTSAHADVGWCNALVVACGEAYKGQPFTEHDPAVVQAARARAMQALEG